MSLLECTDCTSHQFLTLNAHRTGNKTISVRYKQRNKTHNRVQPKKNKVVCYTALSGHLSNLSSGVRLIAQDRAGAMTFITSIKA